MNAPAPHTDRTHLRQLEVFVDDHEQCDGRLPSMVHLRDPYEPPIEAIVSCSTCGATFLVCLAPEAVDDRHYQWAVRKRARAAARQQFERMIAPGPEGVQ